MTPTVTSFLKTKEAAEAAEFSGHSRLADFSADSDAIITKGIVSVLIRAFSGLSAQDIIDAPTDFINEIGLSDHLTSTRANGLVAMIKQMKLYATAFAAQNNA